MYIRLEYSESSGHFHFAALNEKGQNMNGYVTLTPKIACHQAEQFCDQVRQKYPSGDTLLKQPSFAQVQSLFLDFISTEIKAMRETMASINKQRSHLYHTS